MPEPDVEKRKRRRRRAKADVYLSNAHPLPTPEELAADLQELSRFAPDDDDDDLTPGHAEASARNRAMCESADVDKATGNPVSPIGGRSYTEARVSPSVVDARQQQAPSTGDHGTGAFVDPMRPQGPRALAIGHPDLRIGSTSITPWASLRTRQGDDGYGDRSAITYTPGQVGLASLATAGAVGVPEPQANPVTRPVGHIARNSASPPTPGHSLRDPVSHAGAPGAMKASDARAMLKQHMFGNSGRR